MKGSNRTRLIPSLATSAMLAATTLASLSSILVSGNAYAASAPPHRVTVSNSARFIDLFIVNAQSTYIRFVLVPDAKSTLLYIAQG
jgi:hypothetical protein